MSALTFDEVLARGDYELAALRLLLGVLEAIEQAAPEAREELLALAAGEAGAQGPLGEPRGPRHRGGPR